MLDNVHYVHYVHYVHNVHNATHHLLISVDRHIDASIQVLFTKDNFQQQLNLFPTSSTKTKDILSTPKLFKNPSSTYRSLICVSPGQLSHF